MSTKKSASVSNLRDRPVKTRVRHASARKKRSLTRFSTPYMNTLETKGLVVPLTDGIRTAPAVSAETSAASAPSFLSGLGGIEGIMAMMGKVQQLFRMFQQMGPMFKMIHSFAGSKAATASLRNKRAGKTRRK